MAKAEGLRRWPMSSGQLRIWFVEQLAPRTAVHNLFFGVRLTGELDLEALDLSLRAVVDRHEALRTTFQTQGGQPVQLIDQGQPPTSTLIDLSRLSADDLTQSAYARARDEANKPFDLGRGPLIRIVLLRLSAESHILLAVLHHIICDGWSVGLFANELAACYDAFSRDAIPELKPLSLQYGNYASWQREWLQSQDFERQLSHWIERLAGIRVSLDVSASDLRPSEPSFAGFSQALRLQQDLAYQLKAVATRHNTTSFAFLLAVFQIMLCQYSGETDIIVGMPVANRHNVELEDVIGPFANLVAIRTDLSGNPPFSDLLRQVRNTILDALANHDVPFERLVEALHPSRNLAHNPIFQILFASVTAAASWKSFGRLEASPYYIEASTAAFDLSISCIEEAPDTLWIRADYRTDLFHHDQIAGLLDHYVRLLKYIAARPEVNLLELDRPSGWPTENDYLDWQSLAVDSRVTSGNPDTPSEDCAGKDQSQRHPFERDRSLDLIEETLTNLWSKVLGVHPSAPTANFFEIGGHSLMAVDLASEIGRVYRTNFPVSLIFREPTIEGMARRLRVQVDEASSVIPIQEGGSLPPIFFGGSMHEFLDLSRALGSDQPFFQLDIFALQRQRLFANEPLYTSVRDLAARFRQDILSIQPAGPYFLGGMCEGGIVALEIALQLQEEGREVVLLAEFDTPVNGYWRERSIDRVKHGWSLILSRRLVSRIRYHMRARTSTRVKTSPEEETHAYITNVTWGAIRAYHPSRMFEGEIQLFRAPRPPKFREDTIAGWHVRASRGIRVHDVVGDHLEIFRESLSQQIIASVIRRAQRDFVAK